MRDPVILTPEILAMLARLEPDKTKQAKLLTEHLARHRILSSEEEDLQQHLERKAKRELDKQIASTEAEALRQDQAKLTTAAQQTQLAWVIATFAKRAKEAAIAVGAIPKIAEATIESGQRKSETAIADAMTMQE